MLVTETAVGMKEFKDKLDEIGRDHLYDIVYMPRGFDDSVFFITYWEYDTLLSDQEPET